MKTCVTCQFKIKKPVQVSPNEMAMGFFCEHQEVCEPVTGDPLPCNIARSTDNFCGVRGKYWKLRVEKEDKPAPVIQLIK